MALNGIRHKEVSVFQIGLIYVYYLMYFYYLLLFVIHVLLLDNIEDLLMYLSLSFIHCISDEYLYIYKPVGVYI